MNYWKKHLGDYAKDTAHLSLMEHGAYNKLLDLYYTTEKPLPADRVESLILIRTAPEKKSVRKILNEFFKRRATSWFHSRCDKEIKKLSSKCKISQENGKKGGRPKTQSEPTNNPLGSRKKPSLASHKPIANSHKPVASNPLPPSPTPPARAPSEPAKRKSKATSILPAGFLRFWEAYPNTARRTARTACVGIWERRGLEEIADVIVTHVEACAKSDEWRRGYEPMTSTYLNQRRWESPPPSEEAALPSTKPKPKPIDSDALIEAGRKAREAVERTNAIAAAEADARMKARE